LGERDIVALHLETREREGIEIIDLQGRLTMGQEDLLLRDRFDRLIAAGKTRLILNMEGVLQVDSTGLGTLAFTQERLKPLGGKVLLLHLSQAQMELLVYVKLGAVFEIFTDEQDAINSFYPGRTVHRFDILSFVQTLRQSPDPKM